jgi:hypothetical protein
LPDAACFLYADNRVLYWQPDAPFTLDVADFEAPPGPSQLASSLLIDVAE